jgi:hypothetical protein
MLYEFGKWKIDVDREGTLNYYIGLEIYPKDKEAWLNYHLYLEQMKPEEKIFFDDFGIMPEKCDVDSVGYTDGTYPTFGQYLVKGKYVEMPEEKYMLLEDFLKEGPEEAEEENPILQIEHFNISFLRKDGIFNEAPADLPDGFICLEFSADELPWVLLGKASHVMPEWARWWQPVKKIKEVLHNKKMQKEDEQRVLRELKCDLKAQNIPFCVMQKKQVQAMKHRWFQVFAPPGQVKKAKKVCLSAGNYLWHLFSFEFVKPLEGKRAVEAYKNCEKSDCYLLLSFYDIGIKIKGVDRYIWHLKDCDLDLVMTDRDFQWTFAQTHEMDLGPYFYRK